MRAADAHPYLLLLIDAAAYAAHRLQHAVPVLWRFHAMHHALENVDAINNCTHPLDRVVQQCCTVAAMRLVGIDCASALVILIWAMLLGSWIHTSAPVNWGPLGVLLVDNRSHFEHHRRGSRDAVNFASYLTVWDRLFGTYRPPQTDTLPETGMTNLAPAKSFAAFLYGRAPAAGAASPLRRVGLVAPEGH
jgi:sterol desaturase/sphingolipid hydroxylase (fatty acid hydroxylase superfamily)